MKIASRVFLVCVCAFSLSACQFKSSQPKEEDNNKKTEVREPKELPFDVLTQNMLIDPKESTESTQEIEDIKEQVVSLLDSSVSDPIFSFSHSPVLDQTLIAVGSESDNSPEDKYKKFRAIFLANRRLDLAKVLEYEDEDEFLINPVFSADGISEIGWFAFNREREQTARRISVYSIEGSMLTEYDILPPSGVYMDHYDLAVFSDQFIFKTDRVQKPFANTVFTRAFRNTLQLNPVPLIFNSDAYPQVLPVGNPILFEKLIGYREISQSEQEIFYFLRSDNRFYLISQILSDTPELSVLSTFDGESISGNSELAVDRGVYFVINDLTEKSTFYFFRKTSGDLIEMDYDMEKYGENFTIINS
jgi:hypothetical protein